MKIKFLLMLSIAILTACESEEREPYKLPKTASKLIAGDSAKTWKLAQRFNNKTRMNMGDCFLSYRQTFSIGGSVQDNSGENRGCGETLNAEWEFVKTKEGHYYLKLTSDQIPSLMNIEENYKLFKVLNLTDTLMTLQFNHKQFSDKTTTITDFLVPETVEVVNRDFHW